MGPVCSAFAPAFLAAVCALQGMTRTARAAGPPLPDCTCRNFGEDVPLGSRLCIVTPQGKRIAVCVREQNVTSWRAESENCGDVSQLIGLAP